MDKAVYAARREKLRVKMQAAGLGALLITLDANRYYLSGFELRDHQTNESSGCLALMPDGKDWLCTDARYAEAAARLWDGGRIFIYSGSASAAAQINGLLRGRVNGALGLETHCVSHAFYLAVSAGLSAQAADGLVEGLRMIKDEAEIARMEESMALNHKLMEWVPGALSFGRSEKRIAWEIEQFYRNGGASALAFDSIVGIDANSALPHAVPGEDTIKENCCVLVDCGCRLHDYCSDQTRTFWVGASPPDYFLRALDQVREAQRLALEAVRPGAVCREVYLAAWNYFDSLGVAGRFNHGLGHGVGLQTHEPASFNPKNETVLRPGMVMSVEPGLYYPEWGGVRWEYLALVTEDGCRIL